MAFYSAALAFSPVGQLQALSPGAVTLSVELAYVPRLNESQRSAGYDKPEATNLAPVYPRPRVRAGLPAGFAVEASWLPPARVFGVKANLASVAVTTLPLTAGSAKVMARFSGMAGRVTGPITCNAGIAQDGPFELRTYYRTVCRGQDSRDHFEPRHVTLELAGTRDVGIIRPYMALGARLDAGTRFDIGVALPDGSYRDPDHPILELRSVRPQFAAGASWRAVQWLTLSGEAFYAPGSLFTIRTLLAIGVR